MDDGFLHSPKPNRLEPPTIAMADSTESMQNRGPVVLAVTIALLVASTAVLSLRLVSRIGIVRRVSWDDYFIMLAWVCLTSVVKEGCTWTTTDVAKQLIAFGFSFSICWGTHVGLGRHEVDVLPQWQSGLKRAEYGFSVLYVCTSIHHGFLE